jgi:HAMP domain-containing protein
VVFAGAPDWLNVLLIVSAVVTAAYVIWRRVLRPVSKFLTDADELGPVIRDMAKQFKSDSGSTLKDQINALVRSTAELTRTSADIQQVAEAARAAAEKAQASAVRLATEDRKEIHALRAQLRRTIIAKGLEPE